MYNYVKNYDTISNFAVAVISKKIKNVTFYVNVGEIIPTVDQLINDPQRYFSTGEGSYCGYLQLNQPDGTIFGYDGESKAKAFSHDEVLPDIIQKGDIK